MKILVTAAGIGPETGGARTGILNICRSLNQRGHEVTLFTTRVKSEAVFDDNAMNFAEEEGFKINYYSADYILFGNVLSIPFARAIKREVSQSDIVLIHGLYQFTSTTTAFYCRKYKVPYVLRPHGTLDPFLVYRRRCLLKMAYLFFFEKRNFIRAAAIQYSSEMEQKMTERFISKSAQAIIISEGINLERFDHVVYRGRYRSIHPELENKIIVLFLGRFHQKKGIELLIEAFVRVVSQTCHAHLILAGSGDKSYTEKIMSKIERSGIFQYITVTGHLSNEEKNDILADADIFALPSYGENFGLAVVEAMACGLPVVISDKVGIWREVAEGGAGLVAPCDSDKIADSLKELLNNPGLRSKLGQQGRKLAKSRFSMDEMARRMESAYQTLYARS